MKIEVHQQGEVLNSIENNVIDVQSNTEKANEEIKQANELTKKNRNKIICFSVMAFILACTIIGLILYFTVFKKSSWFQKVILKLDEKHWNEYELS